MLCSWWLHQRAGCVDTGAIYKQFLNIKFPYLLTYLKTLENLFKTRVR